ncbi:AAA family ATPase [Chryseobacterium sp. KMC2]|uniref:AAA family ATPase n=1 Tax=Chryseobacterium sp. KMC2 TaxID=2800705 RepID=UPI00192308FC|nr:AAA family ATPase [Chryseobacterium sp. KMC2]MBL3549339.1 AAA family ATPase [Chryseobacterium sp. KMC2]
MKIETFEAEGVHDYLSYNFAFEQKLTFLIGINGSGKTSVLKLILGLVSPSFDFLNSIEHKYVKVTCSNNNEKIVIESKKTDDNKLKLSLKIGEQSQISNTINKLKKLDGITSEEFRKLSASHIEEFENLTFTKKILEFNTPFFLGLDRRIYEGNQIDKITRIFYSRKYNNYPTNDHLNRSLIEIQEVIYDYYRLIASEQPRINSEFKNKVLLQTFEFIESQEFNILRDKKELSEKREKATEAFKNLKIEGITESLNKFFDSLSVTLAEFNEVQKRKNKDIGVNDIDVIQKWFNNQPQLKKIDSLISFNKKYQDEIQQLYEPIEKTKTIINQFLKESRKELIIDPKGELKIKLKNNDEVNIYELSSGEKQILILLGNLIYFVEKSKNDPGIFIVDEPELSLHLSWQEIFVKSLIDASPNTQFIIATHSPAIINDFSSALCNDLATLNL